jgi:MFS superfamily sulfate permease-like transporter
MRPMIERYARETLASVVVFLVALPLCMGIAIASNVPPALGLVSGIVGGIVVGAFSGAPLQVSGPAAGLAVIVFQAVENHGIEGMAMMVLIAGVLQIAAGLLKLGRWFRAVSPAVIGGMLTGIGVLIAASQFHVMVDDTPRASGVANILSVPESIYKGVVPLDGSPHHLAAMIGLLTLILLIGSERIKRFKALPGALVAVAGASIAAAFLGLPISYVTVPENLLASLSLPTAATLAKHLADPGIWFGGLGMGIVASAESLLCATALDKMHSGPRANYDAEMRAQGIGNVIAGLVGALPITGVIVRSTANIQGGARTRLSAILHGVWLLVLVVILPHILRLVPRASLAAILVYTGYKLISPARIIQLARRGRGELLVFIGTVTAIVVTDLLKGVVFGVVIALLKLQLEAMRIEISIERDASTNQVDLHVRGAATFVRLPDLAVALEQIKPAEHAHVHLYLNHLDHACLELITEWEQQRRNSAAETSVTIHPAQQVSMSAGSLTAELDDKIGTGQANGSGSPPKQQPSAAQ